MIRIILTLLILCSTAFASELTTSFLAGELDPLIKYRVDLEARYAGVDTLENMFVKPTGGAIRRPGTKYIKSYAGTITTTDSVPYTGYKTTYISENGSLWGINVNGSKFISLEGDANNVGGGVVGLPCVGHPFIAGQKIYIQNASSYTGYYTVLASTTANEIQITATYVAKTFDETNTVIQRLALASGIGRMDFDANGCMYVKGTGNCLAKIDKDAIAINNTFFTPSIPWVDNSEGVEGIKVTKDNQYVYYYDRSSYGNDRLSKFNLSNGSEVWTINTPQPLAYGHGYNIDIDNSGNVYVCEGGSGSGNYSAAMYAATDGTKTEISNMLGSYDVLVDNDIQFGSSGNKGFISTGGVSGLYADPADYRLYNLAIMTLDRQEFVHLQVGGIYKYNPSYWRTYLVGSDEVISLNGYIYVSLPSLNTIYKLDPAVLSQYVTSNPTDPPFDPNNYEGCIVAKAENITDLIGLYVNHLGQIVAVCADYGGNVDPIFRIYTPDLVFSYNLENQYDGMLKTWATTVGNAYFRGNVCFLPKWTSSTYISETITTITTIDVNTNGERRLIPFEYSTDDAYVLAFGDKFIGFYGHN